MFTPEERAYYECRKAEAGKPLSERLSRRTRYYLLGGLIAMVLAAVGFYMQHHGG